MRVEFAFCRIVCSKRVCHNVCTICLTMILSGRSRQIGWVSLLGPWALSSPNSLMIINSVALSSLHTASR